MTRELLSTGIERKSTQFSISFEYGFLADGALIAIGLSQAGEELTEKQKGQIANCRQFLTDLVELDEKDTFSAMIHDQRLFGVLSSGDVHEALGITGEDKDEFVTNLSEFSETLKQIEEIGQAEQEKFEKVCQFLSSFGHIQLKRSVRLLRG